MLKLCNVQLSFINAGRLETFGLNLGCDSNGGHTRFGLFLFIIILCQQYLCAHLCRRYTQAVGVRACVRV